MGPTTYSNFFLYGPEPNKDYEIKYIAKKDFKYYINERR